MRTHPTHPAPRRRREAWTRTANGLNSGGGGRGWIASRGWDAHGEARSDTEGVESTGRVGLPNIADSEVLHFLINWTRQGSSRGAARPRARVYRHREARVARYAAPAPPRCRRRLLDSCNELMRELGLDPSCISAQAAAPRLVHVHCFASVAASRAPSIPSPGEVIDSIPRSLTSTQPFPGKHTRQSSRPRRDSRLTRPICSQSILYSASGLT